MDVAGEGARAAAGAAGVGSGGFIHAVAGFSSASTPLFFWLLTLALVAAIHVASGRKPPSSTSSPSEEDREAERKPRSRRGFVAGGMEEEPDRDDDRVLQMMRSFSFVHASEEDFVEATYGRAFDGDAVPETVAPAALPMPAAPDSPPGLTFSFRNQLPEIPREAAPVPVKEEKEPPIPFVHVGKHEHEREREAEETEVAMEEEDESGEAVEAEPKIVPVTHNYRFLTERDFRGFVREPESMTVRVQESFVPAPAAAQPEERRVLVDGASRRAGGFVTANDFQPAIKPVARDRVESFVPPPPPAPAAAQPEERRVVLDGASRRAGGFVTAKDFQPAIKPVARDRVESLEPPPRQEPAAARPEERRVVDGASRRAGGFVTADSFQPATKPVARDRVAKRTPSRRRGKPARSPSVASKGTGGGGRASFASEFSGFGGDSDSDSSTSDGYSVRDLVVDSDSDWFVSEKDFPAAPHDAATLRSYKAKVLKAMESVAEADALERSFRDSAPAVSPASLVQASPDSIKYPADLWSRSPSPDADYTQDEHKVTRQAQDDIDGEGSSIDMSDDDDDDDQRSWSSKKMVVAPVYDADSSPEDSLEHSEKEIITINDHSYEAVSDAKSSPDAATDRELVVSSHQAPHDAKRSPAPSEREHVGTNDHSSELVPVDRGESGSTDDQSEASASDGNRSPEHDFEGTEGHPHELIISDVWKEIASGEEEAGEVAYDFKRSPEPSNKESVSSNAHSSEVHSDDDRKAVVHTNYQSNAVGSDGHSIPEHSEQEFGANGQKYGPNTDGKNISDALVEDKHDSADDHPGKSPRHVQFSITEKAKSLDGEDDQEGKWKDLTEEEEDELESLWEHQDLIEQLKLELKKVRSVGLPTILEESETPKTPMEDLKPWRIDAKFLREDPMDELNKFFKSYRERMRKFDILCYQKMYAIDFLQLRWPQQSTNSGKTMSPTVTSILSHNFRSSRRRSPEDSSERFLKELRYDLETVYVGQMCLSWEFLRWQYEQARDLPESDPYHSHQYNQVAGEFQQFQVVVQRFVEDESFKGPRLPNYINNRCVLRNLLQVPVIKEDSLKDRMEDQRKGNFVITSEELEYVMEESMHILWEFIKADRAETPGTSVLKGLSSPHVELQDPMDQDLMMHIHATLQKKEKRLKDLLRTGNCIVKKFKKPKEADRTNQNLFFSQVDMRLVARVLRMPRITSEQLQWCKAKLDKIVLVENRRIHREAAFLLFPC